MPSLYVKTYEGEYGSGYEIIIGEHVVHVFPRPIMSDIIVKQGGIIRYTGTIGWVLKDGRTIIPGFKVYATFMDLIRRAKDGIVVLGQREYEGILRMLE